ncbi:hypothetical protein Tco_0070951 [Tanacetum coccineum]
MASGGSNRDAKYTLSKLSQMGTVAEYQSEFEILINRVTGISIKLLKSFYISGIKPTLLCALLWSNPITLDEPFSLARATEARFMGLQLLELLRSNLTTLGEAFFRARVQVQDLEETIRHKPNKVEAVKTSMIATSEEHEHQENQDNQNEIFEEKDDVKPPISADTFGSNAGNDSETSGPKTPTKEVVENNNGFALTFLVGYGSPRALQLWKKIVIEDVLVLLDSGGAHNFAQPNTGTEIEVVAGFLEEFQDGDMLDALSRVVEQNSSGNWKELDNESKDMKVERDAEREGEPTILATFGSDRAVVGKDSGKEDVRKAIGGGKVIWVSNIVEVNQKTYEDDDNAGRHRLAT